MVGGYKFLDYMSDAYIEAWGDSLEEAFAYAAAGFYDTMINYDSIEAHIKEDITVEGHDIQELLYNWIEELIYIFETKGMIFKKFYIKIYRDDDRWVLNGELLGERYSKAKHGSKTHVKAVTYHAMEIEMRDGARIRYILDL